MNYLKYAYRPHADQDAGPVDLQHGEFKLVKQANEKRLLTEANQWLFFKMVVKMMQYYWLASLKIILVKQANQSLHKICRLRI